MQHSPRIDALITGAHQTKVDRDIELIPLR